MGRLGSDIEGGDRLESLILAMILMILMNLMMILMILMSLMMILMIILTVRDKKSRLENSDSGALAYILALHVMLHVLFE
jgi:hypothetical protein